MPYARYIRCISVEILEKEDLSVLFGEHGQAVVTVLNRAAALTREQALEVSSARHRDASEAYDRTFRRWADSLDDAVWHARAFANSPINSGLTLIHHTVSNSAKAVDGEKATSVEDEGEVELVEPWAGAGLAFMGAGLALGAPKFVTAADRAILLAGWSTLESRLP